MFIIVGVNEHVIVLESRPYNNSMFGGTVQLAMIGKDNPALIAGPSDEVVAFGEAWAVQPKDQPADLGAMLVAHGVCFINRPMDSTTPMAYFRDAAAVGKCSAVRPNADEPFTYCHPNDEQSPLVTELKRAVLDFNAHPEERWPEVCQNIGQFLVSLLTLPPDAKLTYVNFRTAAILSALLVSPADNPAN